MLPEPQHDGFNETSSWIAGFNPFIYLFVAYAFGCLNSFTSLIIRFIHSYTKMNTMSHHQEVR